MKRFEKEMDYQENGIIKYIGGMIDGRLGGDWTNYEVGDIVIYNFDLDDEGYLLDLKEVFNIELSDIKQLIGKGICIVIDEDIWYNVSFIGDVLIVEFIVLECF
jgi:hypothetical protein